MKKLFSVLALLLCLGSVSVFADSFDSFIKDYKAFVESVEKNADKKEYDKLPSIKTQDKKLDLRKATLEENGKKMSPENKRDYNSYAARFKIAYAKLNVNKGSETVKEKLTSESDGKSEKKSGAKKENKDDGKSAGENLNEAGEKFGEAVKDGATEVGHVFKNAAGKLKDAFKKEE